MTSNFSARVTRSTLALALAVSPLAWASYEELTMASAYAKSGSGSGGSGSSHSGGSDDHSGSDSSGSGHSGSGSSNSGSGGGDDHSGRGRGDDDDGNRRGDDNGRRGNDDDNNGRRRGAEHVNPANGAKVEISGRNIEVRYSSGIKEEVEAGRYEMKDASGRTVVERMATQADINRLRALAP